MKCDHCGAESPVQRLVDIRAAALTEAGGLVFEERHVCTKCVRESGVLLPTRISRDLAVRLIANEASRSLN